MSGLGEVSVNIHNSMMKCAVLTKVGPLKSPCTSLVTQGWVSSRW